MTLAPPENSGEPVVEAVRRDDGDIRPVVRQRVAKRKRRRRRVVIVQAICTVVFVALLASLAFVGWRSAMRITGGRSNEVTDPAAPGYLAEVKPTSVSLVAMTGGPGGDGNDRGETFLASLMMVIENGPGDVKVVPVSPRMTLSAFEEAGPDTAEAIFADGGIDVLRLRLGADTTFGSTSVLTVPMSAIQALATQAGPVTFQNPDAVVMATLGNTIETKFAGGELTLSPEQVVEFLGFPGHLEDSSNRVLRTTALWQQLLTQLGEQGASSALTGVEGEQIDAFGELMEQMGATEVAFDLLPTKIEPQPDGLPGGMYTVEGDGMPDWVSTHVSFPVSAYPGQRPSVAVMNGTTNDDAPRAVSPKIVYAGGEIVQLGNAESFDLATSSVEYESPEAQGAAERIAAELGVSATQVESDNDVDVAVVVGKDLVP